MNLERGVKRLYLVLATVWAIVWFGAGLVGFYAVWQAEGGGRGETTSAEEFARRYGTPCKMWYRALEDPSFWARSPEVRMKVFERLDPPQVVCRKPAQKPIPIVELFQEDGPPGWGEPLRGVAVGLGLPFVGYGFLLATIWAIRGFSDAEHNAKE